MRKRGIAKKTKKRLEGTQNQYLSNEFTRSRVDTLHVRTSNRQTFSEKLERIQQGREALVEERVERRCRRLLSILVAAHQG